MDGNRAWNLSSAKYTLKKKKKKSMSFGKYYHYIGRTQTKRYEKHLLPFLDFIEEDHVFPLQFLSRRQDESKEARSMLAHVVVNCYCFYATFSLFVQAYGLRSPRSLRPFLGLEWHYLTGSCFYFWYYLVFFLWVDTVSQTSGFYSWSEFRTFIRQKINKQFNNQWRRKDTSEGCLSFFRIFQLLFFCDDNFISCKLQNNTLRHWFVVF